MGDLLKNLLDQFKFIWDFEKLMTKVKFPMNLPIIVYVYD